MVLGYLLTGFGLGLLFSGIILRLLVLALIGLVMTAGGGFSLAVAIRTKQREDEIARLTNTTPDGRRRNVCPHCGLNLTENTAVCPKCGNSVYREE